MTIATKNDVIFVHVILLDDLEAKRKILKKEINSDPENNRVINLFLNIVKFIMILEGKVIACVQHAFPLEKYISLEYSFRVETKIEFRKNKDRISEILDSNSDLNPTFKLNEDLTSCLLEDCEKVMSFVDKNMEDMSETIFINEEKFCINAVHFIAKLYSVADNYFTKLLRWIYIRD